MSHDLDPAICARAHLSIPAISGIVRHFIAAMLPEAHAGKVGGGGVALEGARCGSCKPAFVKEQGCFSQVIAEGLIRHHSGSYRMSDAVHLRRCPCSQCVCVCVCVCVCGRGCT